MQFPSLRSGNRFSCLSGQFQESKETDHGLGQGLQNGEKGLLPPSTEKSLRTKKKKKGKKTSCHDNSRSKFLTGTSFLPSVG